MNGALHKQRVHLSLLAAIIVVSGATSVSAAVPGVPPPVQAFFSYPQISDVQISPDGKYLAMVVADDETGEDRKSVIVMDAGDHKVTAEFRAASREMIFKYWWANDQRLLIATATVTGSFDAPLPNGRLWGINVDGSDLVPLLGVAPNASDAISSIPRRNQARFFRRMLYISPDNAKRVIVQTWTAPDKPDQAYSVDIYNMNPFNVLGGSQLVAESPAANGELLTDNSGLVRLALGFNVGTGTEELFYRGQDTNNKWKDLSSLYNKDDPAFSSLQPLGFAADNQTIYWLGRTPSSTLGLYALDPDTLKTTLLFGDPGSDIGQVITSFDWQKTQHIVAVTTMPGYPAVHILDNKSTEGLDLSLLYATFPDDMVDITSNTRNKSLVVVYVHSDQNPGSYYLFDAKTKTASLLFNSLPGIDPQHMASVQPVTFKARDGVTLHGYLTLPPGSNGKNLPLIINPHGGPHGICDQWGWNPEAQFFTAHGYAWLEVNYRGSGCYGMKFQDLGYRHWATTMQSDLADAVHWAVQQGIADPGRVCIYGRSYGGYAALENSILYPDLYKCTVGYAGAYNLTLLTNSDFAGFAFGNRYLNAVLGDDPAILKAESPVYNADKIRDPVFIVYGGSDRRVIPENSREMIAALAKAGKAYQVMYEQYEGHGFSKPEHRFELYTRMLAFFDKYIGPGAATH